VYILNLFVSGIRDSDKREEGISPLTEEFNPCKYLAMVHGALPFSNLSTTGTKNLARTIEEQKEELKELVRDNLEKFISCIDTVNDTFSTSDFKQRTKDLIVFDGTLKESQRKAKTLFSPLIERKETGEKIRSALLVISKMKLMLAIPSLIKEYMQTVCFTGNFAKF